MPPALPLMTTARAARLLFCTAVYLVAEHGIYARVRTLNAIYCESRCAGWMVRVWRRRIDECYAESEKYSFGFVKFGISSFYRAVSFILRFTGFREMINVVSSIFIVSKVNFLK